MKTLFKIDNPDDAASERFGIVLFNEMLRIYKDGNDEAVTKWDLCSRLRLTEKEFSRGIKWARSYARERGLIIPDACSAEGNTYYLTDDPNLVLAPAWAAQKKALGHANNAHRHVDFLRKNHERINTVEGRTLYGVANGADKAMSGVMEMINSAFGGGGDDAYRDWKDA